MSAQFALDPALASNTPSTDPPTASPAHLTKTPSKTQPKPQPQNQNPGYYSILPALPPLPGWGPFPGPMFSSMPPMYMVPPPPPPGAWHAAGPELAHQPVQAPPQVAAPTPTPASAPAPAPPKPPAQAKAQHPPPRPRRAEPPPLNPAAAASPHYQNPGGFGGVYTPPTQSTSNSNSTSHASGSDPAPPGSHYTHKPSDNPQPLTDLGRPFACGINGCGAAFDRKSDCERHRRTHAKGGADTRPFKCSRAGCEAAFDRKDALMRHERNERTHLVRQTQPGGRIKRPTRTPSKTDETTPTPDPPRRMSTRKRKSVPSMYVDASESEFEDDDEEVSSKRPRGDDDGSGNEGIGSGNEEGNNMEDMVVIPPDEQLVIDPALDGLGPSSTHGRPGEGYAGLGVGDMGIGVGGTGLGVGSNVVETLQAVEAIQAALQQMEADADAEKGRGV